MTRPDGEPVALGGAAAGLRLRVFGAIDDARTWWHRFESVGEGYAFQSYAWQRAWADTVATTERSTPCIAVLTRADDTPWMLLPLAVQRRAGARCLVFAGGDLCDYHAPLLGPDFHAEPFGNGFAALWDALRAALPAHDALAFDRQPATLGGASNPLATIAAIPHASSAHYVRLEGDFETFLARKRSAKTRSTERRKRRRLERHGTLTFTVARTAEEAEPIVATLLRQKSDNYRELGVRDLFAESRYRNFVRCLTERHVADGLVHVSALQVGEHMVATHWGLLHRSRLYYLLPAYERGELASLSPGNALLHSLLEWCCANGVAVCDFTVGDEPYKYLWRDGELQLFDCISPCSARGRLYTVPKRMALLAKRRVKRSPRLLHWLYGVRAAVGGRRSD